MLEYRRGVRPGGSAAGGWLGLRVRCRAAGERKALEQSGGAGLFFLDGEEPGLDARLAITVVCLAVTEVGLESAHVGAHPSDESDDECRESDSDSDDAADDAEQLRVGHDPFLSGGEYTVRCPDDGLARGDRL